MIQYNTYKWAVMYVGGCVLWAIQIVSVRYDACCCILLHIVSMWYDAYGWLCGMMQMVAYCACIGMMHAVSNSKTTCFNMCIWLRIVSVWYDACCEQFKLRVYTRHLITSWKVTSFAEHGLFYRALLQKRPIISSWLLTDFTIIVAPSSSIWYEVATISRLLKIIGLFCKRAL